MEKPKLKKSKTLSINIHEIELKAFLKSMRRRNARHDNSFKIS
jgi:hypothetical protein